MDFFPSSKRRLLAKALGKLRKIEAVALTAAAERLDSGELEKQMADARAREAWNHTSAVLAMIANANRDPKKSRPLKPGDFHPYAGKRRRGIPITAANIQVLKRLASAGRGGGTGRPGPENRGFSAESILTPDPRPFR